jgi:anti-sigma factor RsiW
MNCLPEFTYAIYADGELPPEEAREVESHLVHCPRCLKLVHALQAENRMLAAVLDEVEVSAPLTARPLQPAAVLWLAGAVLALVGGLQVLLRAWAVPAGRRGQVG